MDDNEEVEEEGEEGGEDDSLPDVRHHSRNDVLHVVARHGKVSYKESSVSKDTDIEYMEEAQGGVVGEVGVANWDDTNSIEKILKSGMRLISEWYSLPSIQSSLPKIVDCRTNG